MTHPAPRHSYAVLGTILSASLSLGGCDKLTPNGASDTMSLLRAGSEKVCVAADVQKTLRELIIPKADDVADGAAEDKISAVGSVTLTYDLTTLQGFDKAVSKANCNASVKIAGAGGKSNKFDVDYQVSPAAENATSFIVTSHSDDAKTYARLLVSAAVEDAGTARDAQQQAAQDQQEKAQLLAMITPKWLVGSWIPTSGDVMRCSNGQAYSFRANHQVEGTELNGRWVLNQDQLHAIGQGTNGAAEIDGTITAADQLSFTVTGKDGNALTLRRCSRDEVGTPASTGLPDSFTPSPPTQN